MQKLFQPGRYVATPGAVEVFQQFNTDPFQLLERHLSGDWGEVCESDRKENDISVMQGFRILSSYPVGLGVKLWVITEADRSRTTVLLPDEY